MDEILPPEQAPRFVGDARTIDEVNTLLARGAFEGGFLLLGPEGQGKATLAYQLAAAIVSGSQDLNTADRTARQLIAAGSHPDVLTLRRSVNEKTGKLRQEIDVEGARSVISRLHQTSTTGRRVVIIDLADHLGRSAANSLLKMLEEPPAGTCFLLLSLSTSRLLPTLISRCRRIVLRPVGDDALTEWLREHDDFASSDLPGIVEAAHGAPGRALKLAAGEGSDALQLADTFFAAVPPGGDLLAATRPFSAKNNELVAEEARGLIMDRLRRGVLSAAPEQRSQRLDAFDETDRLFREAGTADAAQTALMVGMALRRQSQKAAH
ncbi:MAG: AAA family ATPase [Parvularculaceae bacterium]|nr:AAA family ATPase [Parvularculaceae bacterium]